MSAIPLGTAMQIYDFSHIFRNEYLILQTISGLVLFITVGGIVFGRPSPSLLLQGISRFMYFFAEQVFA